VLCNGRDSHVLVQAQVDGTERASRRSRDGVGGGRKTGGSDGLGWLGDDEGK
jgi:hypothetical protein